MKDSRRVPEMSNSVPHAVETGLTMQLPPPEARPSRVTDRVFLNTAGTRLPQEKLTGEIRQ